MKSIKVLSLGFIVSLAFVSPVQAALDVGDMAPGFALEASLGGKAFEFDIVETLQNGPVVLYFYPKAFTPGCTVEAHEFAEASDEFASYGATILGVSADDIDTLHKFSVSECRDKFAVAADPEAQVIQAYDASLQGRSDLAGRISYVIAPSGEILHVLDDPAPQGHITQSMEAVKSWYKANLP